MAHKLEIRDGKTSLFVVKEKPWHGLGTIVDEALTSEEAIRTAHLDYTVVKAPNFTDIYYDEVLSERRNNLLNIPLLVDPFIKIPKDRLVVNPASFSTYRTDTRQILGSVGSDYQVYQNVEAFAFFDDIVKEKKAIFETAGVLGRGERVFITAKLPDNIRVVGDDIVDKYLLLTNSHNGLSSIEVMFTNIRVVCNNTLMAAMNSATSKYRVMHTVNAKNRLSDAANILRIEHINSKSMQEVYQAMANTKVTDNEAMDYIRSVFMTADEIGKINNGVSLIEAVSTRKYNLLDSVENYYYTGAGQDLPKVQGTLWAGYNAITGYFQNVARYSSPDDKIKSMYYGNHLKVNDKSLQIAKQMMSV